MINVTFDQYQRYNNVRRIVEEMRSGGEVFTILEVGANEHQNLERFLPIDEITYLDIQLPEHLRNNPKYLLGDATAMDLPDNHYDVIVALDVFEHIPPGKREAFINELYRVSAKFFVITAPFDTVEVVEAEKRANAVHQSIFHSDFIWLDEHRSNGLPNLEDLEHYLASRNMIYQIRRHGNIALWERLFTLHFVAASNPALATFRAEIDKYYNTHLFDLDYGVNTYRKIIAVSKSGSFPEQENLPQTEASLNKGLEQLQRLEDTFYRLTGLLETSSRGEEDFIQLFINTGNGFSEQESRVFKQAGDWKWSSVAIRDIPAVPLVSLRIDPSRYKGTYAVRNISLVSRDAENVRIPDQVPGNYEMQLNNDTYYFQQDDPYLIVNLAVPQEIAEIRFEVFRLDEKETLVSVVSGGRAELSRLSEKHRNELESQVGDLNRELADSRRKLADSEQKLADSRQELDRLTGSRSWKLMVKLKKLIKR